MGPGGLTRRLPIVSTPRAMGGSSWDLVARRLGSSAIPPPFSLLCQHHPSNLLASLSVPFLFLLSASSIPSTLFFGPLGRRASPPGLMAHDHVSADSSHRVFRAAGRWSCGPLLCREADPGMAVARLSLGARRAASGWRLGPAPLPSHPPGPG